LFTDDGSEGVKVYEHRKIDSSNKSVSYPRNSYYKVVFPLEQNHQIRDRFTNYFSDGLRIGRILEVLDYMAAYISYRYENKYIHGLTSYSQGIRIKCLNNLLFVGDSLNFLLFFSISLSLIRHCYSDIETRIVTNVTACVDNMNFYSQLRNDVDLEVQGKCCFLMICSLISYFLKFPGYVTQVGNSSMEI